MRRPQRYDVSVFLNCPFDDGYRPLLHAAILAIQDCGFPASFGHQARARGRDLLILAAEPFQDKRTLSDLAGQDAKYHHARPADLIKAVRSFRAAKAKIVLPADTSIRGHSDIFDRFERFKLEVEALATSRRIRLDEINSFDYLPDWLALAVAWQAATR